LIQDRLSENGPLGLFLCLAWTGDCGAEAPAARNVSEHGGVAQQAGPVYVEEK
jgi:hypothetical protein